MQEGKTLMREKWQVSCSDVCAGRRRVICATEHSEKIRKDKYSRLDSGLVPADCLALGQRGSLLPAGDSSGLFPQLAAITAHEENGDVVSAGSHYRFCDGL